jgi:hypothetical protein
MKMFFAEVKKYSAKLIELIMPEPSPSTTAPSSSVPPAMETAPNEVA